MGVTALGASVKRTEDIRFITGKGHYVDDINRPGQAYAYFLRSPHAHATIDKIDASAALKSPGVVAIFTGDDIAADKVGGLICGWMIHSKDGSPMNVGAPSRARAGARCAMSAIMSPSSSPTHTLRRRTRRKRSSVDYGVLPAVIDVGERRQGTASAQIHDAAPNNTVYNWHLGDKAATDAAFASAAHVTKIDLVNNRLIPNAMEPRAAVGDYDSGTDTMTLYTTSQNPHVARVVLSAFIGLAPENKLRVIAPDVGGGFGSKIFIYADETVCALGGEEDRPAGEMDRRSHRGLSLRRAWARPRHAWRTRARRKRQDHRAARPHDRQSRRLSVDVRFRRADISLRAAAVGTIRDPQYLLRGRRGLHQHRAGRRLSRRRPPGGDIRDRASG